MGDKPKFRLSDWESQAKSERFELRRSVAWNHNLRQPRAEGFIDFSEFHKGEPSAPLFGVDSLKHNDYKIFSLINIPLWDKAGWSGIVYSWSTDAIPLLALGFKDINAGLEIFREWHNKLGPIDEEEQLRITILTGIDKHHPANYRVSISINPKVEKNSKTKLLFFTTRTQLMEPPNLHNLNTFIEHYNHFGKYVLLPGQFASDLAKVKLFDYGIIKRELRICEAWQLGSTDRDVHMIHEGDNPISKWCQGRTRNERTKTASKRKTKKTQIVFLSGPIYRTE